MVLTLLRRIVGFDMAGALASSSREATRLHKARVIGFIVALVTLWILQTLARSVILVLSRDHPLLLATIDSRAHVLVLVAVRVPLFPLVLAASVGRFAEHFLYYLLGRWAGEPAFVAMRRRSGRVARVVRRAELAFARAGNVAVLVLSDRPVCILAGASRMSPLRFTLLHFPGTVLRVAAAAYAARSSSHLVRPWLTVLEQHIDLVTTLTIVATLAWIAILAYRGRRATMQPQITQPEGTERRDPPP